VTGSTLWSFTPTIVPSLPSSFISLDVEDTSTQLTQFSFTATLLKIRLHSRADHPVELALVVSVEKRQTHPLSEHNLETHSALLTYQFHGLTGIRLNKQPHQQQQTCAQHNTCPTETPGSQMETVRSPDRVILDAGHVQTIQLVDTHLTVEKIGHTSTAQKLHSEQSYYQHSMQHYLLIHSPLALHQQGISSPRVSVFPPLSSPHIQFSHGSNLYTHLIHRQHDHEGLSSFTVCFSLSLSHSASLYLTPPPPLSPSLVSGEIR
jgi:hypothetical protein